MLPWNMAGRRGRSIYSTRRWARIRRHILARDRYRCRGCGKTGVLEVHHRVSLADGGEPFAERNLLSLCLPCHTGRHHPPPAEVVAWQELMADDGA